MGLCAQDELWAFNKRGKMNELLQDSMDRHHDSMDFDTCVCLLQGCTSATALAEGRKIHDCIIKSEVKQNVLLQNTILNMYVKCGSICDAYRIFENMLEKNVFTWTLMIAGYVDHQNAEVALKLFWTMRQEGVNADKVTFLSILKACAMAEALERGKQIHIHIMESGVSLTIAVANTLIDMYAKCRSIENAWLVFDRIPKPDMVSWTAMISGYAQQGLEKQAIGLFEQMLQQHLKPSEITFITILKACGSLEDLEQGHRIHSHIVNSGLESATLVGNALLDMYAKCGSVENAREVFDSMNKRDVISWTAIISGYVYHGQADEALKLFQQMQLENMEPNDITLLSVLTACTSLLALQQGKQVHGQIITRGFESCMAVGSTLVDLYAKCGSLHIAREVFERMHIRDVVTWNIMIAGYAEHGQSKDAFHFFQRMEADVTPDEVTFVNVLKACASSAMVKQGKQVHAYLFIRGFESDLSIANTLVDMYVKCGSIENAREVFDRMPCLDVVSWNAMIVGYAQNGYGESAIKLFEQMCHEGVKLNHVTFIGVLSACSHVGLVNEGHQYFDSMQKKYGIVPTSEHYGCMVDLLGRAGCLHEALDFIKRMPSQPCAVVWRALLSACRIYGDVELAKCAAENILKLEPCNSSVSVLLSNMYAAVGRWDDRDKARSMLDDVTNEAS